MPTFQNQATLTYTGGTVSSNTVTGTLNETVTVNKASMYSNYGTGDYLTFVINFINTGSSTLNNLTVTDNLGENQSTPTLVTVPMTYVDGSLLYYVNGIPAAAPTVSSQNPLTFSGINLPAGAVGTIVYQANVNEFAPVVTGSSITNTANVSGGGLLTPISASWTLAVNETPDLQITKSLSPTTVTENGEITYTFLIENYGNTPATADDLVTLTDTFDPTLSNLTVLYNGTPWALTTNYTYDTTTGVFSTVGGQITVPAATGTQNPATGAWSITPGSSTLTVTGTV